MALAVGSVRSSALGLHVHVALREGALVELRLAASGPAARQDAAAAPLLARLAAHLEGRRDDLRDVPVDLAGVPGFHRAALEAVRDVPPGQVVTYGELARRLGKPGASRAVGAAMARNPVPLVVPCHRVLPSDGRPGSYSGEGGWATKVRLLQIERAPGFAAVQARLAA